jgi:hypothetical protein
METQCVFCCVRNEFLCTFTVWVLKVESVINLAVVFRCVSCWPVLWCRHAVRTLCALVPSQALAVSRFAYVGLRFASDGCNLVQIRRAVVSNSAAIRCHHWSSDNCMNSESGAAICGTRCAGCDRYSTMAHAPASSSGRFALRLENCIPADISFLRS